MADSISIKDKKMQKFESKKLGRENQERADKEIRGMEAEVDSGSRSSRIKSLSAAKKKEMLEEYEKVIKKLKELELRNKKKENFKHSFKGLKYFPTLNGHSVYSESMQSQAKADKESISAMMAYGQLGAGFEVTFEQFMVHVRPERKQEFLSLCKNNSTLSHNLMGMGKVLQFYNQRDFTRAYAAMVFFGLENHMDLMETFLKVKFNADFKMQVNKFKEQVANASVFEEKAIREEAGTNVFSQHDSQMTSMQSSYYGKSVSATIQYNSEVYTMKTKEEKTKILSDIYTKAYEECGGDLKKVRDVVFDTTYKMHKEERETLSKVVEERYRAKKERLLETPGDTIVVAGTTIDKTVASAAIDSMTVKDKARVYRGIRSQQIREMYERSEDDTPESKKTKIMAARETDWEKAQREIGSNAQKISDLRVDLERAEDLETRANIEKQIQELEDANIELRIILECNSDAFDLYKSQYEDDKSALEKKKTEKLDLIKILSEREGYEDKIAILKAQVEELEPMITKLPDAPDAKVEQLLVLQEFNDNALAYLSGEKPINVINFNEAIKRFTPIKNKSAVEVYIGNHTLIKDPLKTGSILPEDQVLSRVVKNYRAILGLNGMETYETIAESLVSQIDTEISKLTEKVTSLKEQRSKTEDKEEKRKLGTEVAEISGRINKLENLKKELYEERDKVAKELRRKKEESKTPEQKLENVLKYVDSRLKTNVNGEDVYLDTLKPDEIPERINISKTINDVLSRLESVSDLELETISKESISLLQSNLTRATTLLERLKGKISEEEFEVLKSKSDSLKTYFEEWSSGVKPKKIETGKVETETKGAEKTEEMTIELSSDSDALCLEIIEGVTNPAGQSGLTNKIGKLKNNSSEISEIYKNLQN